MILKGSAHIFTEEALRLLYNQKFMTAIAEMIGFLLAINIIQTRKRFSEKNNSCVYK